MSKAKTAVASDTWGAFCKVELGKIDSQVKYLFSHGQCHALALAIAEHTGLGLSIVASYDFQGNLFDQHHVVVDLGNGLYGDIYGVKTRQQLIENYQVEGLNVCVEDGYDPKSLRKCLKELEGWQPEAKKIARSIVIPCLENWGFPHYR